MVRILYRRKSQKLRKRLAGYATRVSVMRSALHCALLILEDI